MRRLCCSLLSGMSYLFNRAVAIDEYVQHDSRNQINHGTTHVRHIVLRDTVGILRDAHIGEFT